METFVVDLPAVSKHWRRWSAPAPFRAAAKRGGGPAGRNETPPKEAAGRLEGHRRARGDRLTVWTGARRERGGGEIG